MKNGDSVKGIVAPTEGNYSRKKIDSLVEYVKELGGSGLIWIVLEEDYNSSNFDFKSIVKKYLDDEYEEGEISPVAKFMNQKTKSL